MLREITSKNSFLNLRLFIFLITLR